MIINQTYKFIFLKTRKAASTSLENYFNSYSTSEDINLTYDISTKVDKRNLLLDTAMSHASAQSIFDVIGIDEWSKYLKITSVRNPYEKIVSAYFFLHEYLNSPLKEKHQEQELFNHWLISKRDHYFFEMCDSDSYKLNGDICADYFIKVESLHTDLKRVCKCLNLEFNPTIIKFDNSTSRPSWATCQYMYSSQSKEIIKNFFKFELDYFNYSFPS